MEMNRETPTIGSKQLWTEMDSCLQEHCRNCLLNDASEQLPIFDWLEENKKKRIKFSDGVMLKRSNSVLIIKSCESQNIHHTIYHKNNGDINLHKTIECKPKIHEPLCDVSAKDVEDSEERFRQIYLEQFSSTKINIKGPRFKDFVVMVKMPSFQTAFESMVQIDGCEVRLCNGVGEAVYDADIDKLIEKHVIFTKLENIESFDKPLLCMTSTPSVNGVAFQKAWLCDKTQVVGRLYENDSTYYFISYETINTWLKTSGVTGAEQKYLNELDAIFKTCRKRPRSQTTKKNGAANPKVTDNTR